MSENNINGMRVGQDWKQLPTPHIKAASNKVSNLKLENALLFDALVNVIEAAAQDIHTTADNDKYRYIVDLIIKRVRIELNQGNIAKNIESNNTKLNNILSKIKTNDELQAKIIEVLINKNNDNEKNLELLKLIQLLLIDNFIKKYFSEHFKLTNEIYDNLKKWINNTKEPNKNSNTINNNNNNNIVNNFNPNNILNNKFNIIFELNKIFEINIKKITTLCNNIEDFLNVDKNNLQIKQKLEQHLLSVLLRQIIFTLKQIQHINTNNTNIFKSFTSSIAIINSSLTNIDKKTLTQLEYSSKIDIENKKLLIDVKDDVTNKIEDVNDNLSNKIADVNNNISNNIMLAVSSIFIGPLSIIFNFIKSAFSIVFKVISSIAKVILWPVKKLFNAVTGLITAGFKTIGNLFKNSSILAFIVSPTGMFMLGFFAAILYKKLIEPVWKWLKDKYYMYVLPFIKSILEMYTKYIEPYMPSMEDIKNTINNDIIPIVKKVTDEVVKIYNFIKTNWDWIKIALAGIGIGIGLNALPYPVGSLLFVSTIGYTLGKMASEKILEEIGKLTKSYYDKINKRAEETFKLLSDNKAIRKIDERDKKRRETMFKGNIFVTKSLVKDRPDEITEVYTLEDLQQQVDKYIENSKKLSIAYKELLKKLKDLEDKKTDSADTLGMSISWFFGLGNRFKHKALERNKNIEQMKQLAIKNFTVAAGFLGMTPSALREVANLNGHMVTNVQDMVGRLINYELQRNGDLSNKTFGLFNKYLLGDLNYVKGLLKTNKLYEQYTDELLTSEVQKYISAITNPKNEAERKKYFENFAALFKTIYGSIYEETNSVLENAKDASVLSGGYILVDNIGNNLSTPNLNNSNIQSQLSQHQQQSQQSLQRKSPSAASKLLSHINKELEEHQRKQSQTSAVKTNTANIEDNTNALLDTTKVMDKKIDTNHKYQKGINLLIVSMLEIICDKFKANNSQNNIAVVNTNTNVNSASIENTNRQEV